MARKKVEKPKERKVIGRAYIPLNGVDTLWYEVYDDGTGKTFLPKEVTDRFKEKMYERIGKMMSSYIADHPESALWGKTN